MKKHSYTTEEDIYRTGDVHPPKNHRGIVAGLLIAVILLSGVVSILSFMNIKLFQQLQSQKESASALHFIEEDLKSFANFDVDIAALGITGNMLTGFDARYYNLPVGVYITHVTENSPAANQGITPGDILLQMGNVQITTIDILQEQLETYTTGQTVTLVIYRNGDQYPVNILVN